MRLGRRTVALATSAMLGASVTACGRADGGGPGHPSTAAPSTPRSWHGFGVDHWPPASWRPYARTSPFNQPIPPGTRPLKASPELAAQALRFGPPSRLAAGVSQTQYDWGHPTYYASTADPVFTLRATAPFGRNPIGGMRIHVPDAALPAGGGDAHMAIVTPDGWEYDLWQVQDKPSGGGTLTFAWGERLRIDGSGTRGGGTASRFGNLAGMIRAQELSAGRIDHALFVVLRCTGDGTGYGAAAHRRSRDDSAYVYPAVSGGAECPPGTLAPPMGARLRLAMSDAQIDALDVPRWKAAILRALARYGGYVGDTGGDGIGFMFESSTMYTSFGRPDPLAVFAAQAGLPSVNGSYAFDIAGGVDWARYLQVVPPPQT